MKQIYSDADPLLIGYLRSVLSDHGIRSFAKNEHLVGASGELPPTELWLELWVIDDAEAVPARRIVDEALAEQGHGPAWICPRCGEKIEKQFTDCWRCSEAPEDSR